MFNPIIQSPILSTTPVLSPELRAIYTVQLKEAEAAYHDLMTGRQVRVVLDQNGERVEFSGASRATLYNYILGLQAILGVARTPMMVPSRPAQFVF